MILKKMIPGAKFMYMTIIIKQVYWYISQISCECLQDSWFSANNYTPGIYADGYIVFAFPFVRSSVRMFVCSFVSSFVIPERSWNLCQSFC